MPDLTTPDYDALVTNAMRCGASTALMEAHRLLCLRNMHDAADALLVHHESISNRAAASYHAQAAIDKAAA